MNTFQSPIHGVVFIDWLRATVPYTKDTLHWIQKRFGEYVARKGGYGGYSHSADLSSGGLMAWSPERPDNRILLEFSSKALAKIKLRKPAKQAERNESIKLIQELREVGAKFRRIDIAIDDTRGLLAMDQLWTKVDAGEFTSRFRKHQRVLSYQRTLSQGKVGGVVARGDTIYLGRRSSETFLRFYDKAAQARMKEQDPEALRKVPEHWIRCEIEIKGDRADYIGGRYEHIDFCQQIRRYVDFRESGYSRIERSPVCSWWLEFLSHASKGAPLFPRHVPSLESIDHWLINISGAIALMQEVRGGGYVDKILVHGRKKLEENLVYQGLLSDHRCARNGGEILPEHHELIKG